MPLTGAYMGRTSELGGVQSPGKPRESAQRDVWNILVHICTFAYVKFIHLANYSSYGQGWINEAERQEEFFKFVRLSMEKESATNYTILQTAS